MILQYPEWAYYLDQDAMVAEIEDRPCRETGSGLLRVDDPIGANISKLIYDFPYSCHEVWAMKHYPGGREVIMHEHNNWETAIYYPHAHESRLILEGSFYQPSGDDLVILPARTSHGVEANTTDIPRYSVVFIYAQGQGAFQDAA